MNILLINPSWPYPYNKGEHTYNRIWPPLSLANCASLLEREGHNVKILDAHALRIKPSKIHLHLNGYDKIFITSSTLDKWICPNIDILPFLETIKGIQKITDEIYIIGHHGTANPYDLIQRTKAKAIILGEPELPVIKICKNIEFKNIANIAFFEKDNFVSTLTDKKLNLKILPIPAFHLLNIKKYSYEILGNNFMLFETSRGCKYNCKFCSKIMAGNKIREKDITQIVKELEISIEKFNIKNGYFIDLDFLSNKKLVIQICNFLIKKKYNFTWCCQTRPDSVDLDTLKIMKKAGCTLIHLGIESGLQKILNLTDKKITPLESQKAVKMCEKAEIMTLGFYVFGFDGETAEDREKIFNFAKDLNTDFISFHKVYPYDSRNNIFLKDIKTNKEINSFIFRKLFVYYFRYSYLKRMKKDTAVRCFKLFLGRLLTLK